MPRTSTRRCWVLLACCALLGRMRQGQWGCSGLALAAEAPPAEDSEFDFADEKPAEVGDDGVSLTAKKGQEASTVPLKDSASGGGAGGEEHSGAAGAWAPEGARQGARRRRDWTYEYIGLAIIVAYALVFISGRKENERIAQAWAKEFRELFEQQFSEVGPAELLGPDPSIRGQLLYKDSASTYLMYATGRRNCKGMLVTLDLRKRHDLFWLAWDMIYPSQDTVVVEAVLQADEPEPFIIAVARKKEHKQLQQQTQDLKDLTTVVASPADLSKSLVVLSDVPSVVSEVLTNPVVKTLSKHEREFQLLHVTDQNTEKISGFEGIPKAVARFKFSIPEVERMADLSKFLEMSLYFVDRLAGGIKLSQQAKQKALAARKEVEQRKYKRSQDRREELLQKKKAEKHERERLMYERMTQEQKLKKDAKDERKRAKEMQNRGMRVKVSK